MGVILMKTLLKMLKRAHSNQGVGICSKDCGGPREEGDSVLEEGEHPAAAQGAGGRSAGGREGGGSVLLLTVTPSLAPRCPWREAPAEASSFAGPWGCRLLGPRVLASLLWDAELDVSQPVRPWTVRCRHREAPLARSRSPSVRRHSWQGSDVCGAGQMLREEKGGGE